MEDSVDLKLRLEDYSHSNLSETPRASIHENNSDFYPSFRSRPKQISFATPNKLLRSQSFITAHSRNASTILSPPGKTLISTPAEVKNKETSLKQLDEKLNKIAEDLNTDRLGGRETGFETFREKGSETLRELYGSTERSTMAKLVTDEWELSDIPTLKWCAYCKKETQTEIEFRNSDKTFWTSVGIFLLGGWIGCFLIPYALNKCKEAKYVCHVCRHEVPLIKDN